MRQIIRVLGIIGFSAMATCGAGCGKGGNATPAGDSGSRTPPADTTSGRTAPAAGSTHQAKLPITVEVKGTSIYSEKCVKYVSAILGKVEGVGEVSCDLKSRLVKFRVRDKDAAHAAIGALGNAGFTGDFTNDDPAKGIFNIVGRPIALGNYDLITFDNVHVCCESCEKAIREVAKGAEVTFVGSGPRKTVQFKGKQLDVSAIIDGLWKAGYKGGIGELKEK